MLRQILSEITEEQLTCLPPLPEEPLASDCCGNGCRVCVVDLYEQEISDWIERAHALLAKVKGSQECKEYLTPTVQGQVELSKRAFTPLKMISRVPISSDTSIFRFDLGPHPHFNIFPGEHLIARVKTFDGDIITREYTPIGIRVKEYFDVMIKIYPDGQFTKYVKKWKVGDEIYWKGPFGRFDHNRGKFDHLVMLAGGTGIAPMIPITQQILDNEDDETRLHLFYSNKRPTDILLKEKLNEFKDYWNFEVAYIFTQISEADEENTKLGYQDELFVSRIDRPFLIRKLATLSSNAARFLICGPSSFEEDISAIVLSLGYPPESIVTFGNNNPKTP